MKGAHRYEPLDGDSPYGVSRRQVCKRHALGWWTQEKSLWQPEPFGDVAGCPDQSIWTSVGRHHHYEYGGVALSFLYIAFIRFLQLVRLSRVGQRGPAIDAAMLRHEVAVLRPGRGPEF